MNHHKKQDKKEVPPPTDADICFGKEHHPGTLQFHRVCQGAVLQYPDKDYGPGIYKAIKRPLKGRRFYVHSKKRDKWVLAGKKSKNRYFENEFNSIKHKHLLVLVEESDPHTESDEQESDDSSSGHHEKDDAVLANKYTYI